MNTPVQNKLLYHAKIGGDINGSWFLDAATYFAPTPDIATAYAEHLACNEADCFDEDLAIQSSLITLFPVLVTLENPAFTDRAFLFKVGHKLSVPERCLDRFADNFEDSCEEERDLVFSLLKSQGYDGAILPNDLMPVCPGGDWEFQTSYVAFFPRQQTQFKLLKNQNFEYT